MGATSSDIIYAHQYKEPEKDSSAIYRAKKSLEGLIDTPHRSCQTMREVILRSLKLYADRPCMGKISVYKDHEYRQTRENSHLNYEQCFNRAKLIGSGLKCLNLCFPAQDMTFVKSKRMQFVGIYSRNSQEWGLIDMACILYGITSIPLQQTLGEQNIIHCLQQTNLTTCFCTNETVHHILTLKNTGNLKNIILLDNINQKTLKQLHERFEILSFQQLIKAGQQNFVDFADIKVDTEDCLTFSYTSGTTGAVKGVMLSHKNFLTTIASFNSIDDCKFKQSDAYLSFLPLSHSLERAFFHGILFSGAFVTFFSGDINKLKDDIQLVRPTIFTGTPRIYSRIAEDIQKQLKDQGFIINYIYGLAMNIKTSNIKKEGNYSHFISDFLLFRSIRNAYGGRIRIMISGGAAIKQETQVFMKAIMSAPLIVGYGQTQNLAGAFVQHINDAKLAHVGGVLTGLEFRLVDLPDLNYRHTDRNQQGQPTPRGQLQVRGPQVFMGYYKKIDKTHETITKDKWLKTGDIGMLEPGSLALMIIDRKKDLFKLSQGQYVSPEKVESIYVKCPYVDQVFIYGESDKDFPVAFVSLKEKPTMEIARSENIEGSFNEICQKRQLRNTLFEKLEEEGKKAGLNGFERAKNIWLESKSFKELEIVTDNEKLKRVQAKQYYRRRIEQMYKEGQMPLK